MQLKVFYDREKAEKKVEIDDNAKVRDLLKKMSINPVTVIVSRNNNVILEDEKLDNNDNIKIISVISGG